MNMNGNVGCKPLRVRQAPFAVRLVKRSEGTAAVLYRREAQGSGKPDRLRRIGNLSPLALLAGSSLLKAGVRAAEGPKVQPKVGPCHALDADWGARIACYAFVSQGLRDSERLENAAGQLLRADATEAAWWLGMLCGGQGPRAARALRILVGAVQ